MAGETVLVLSSLFLALVMFSFLHAGAWEDDNPHGWVYVIPILIIVLVASTTVLRAVIGDHQ